MSMLGKILLVVNFFVAAGLAYLIAQDWSARQNVSGVVARSALTIAGLPVEAPPSSGDDVVVNVEVGGLHVVESVRPKLLAAQFQGAEGGQSLGGGAAPKSQLEEVKRVQSKTDAQIAAAASPLDKLGLLAGRYDAKGNFTPGWLTSLAESYDERQLVRRLVEDATPTAGRPADPQRVEASLADAEKMFRRRFEAVLNKPNPQLAAEETAKLKELSDAVHKADEAARAANKQHAANPTEQTNKQLVAAIEALRAALGDQKTYLTTLGNSATRDEVDRRQRIAHLLAHLDQDAAWQKRVALVAGLRTYLAAVQAQVDRLRDMAASAQQQIILDQAEFAEQYEILKSIANERALLLGQQTAFTADLAVQRRRDQEAVTLRATQLQRRQQELKALQDQVAAEMGRQAEVEQGLLAVQQQVARTERHNLDLRQKLAEAEQKTAAR
jgi:hypothetical protein